MWSSRFAFAALLLVTVSCAVADDEADELAALAAGEHAVIGGSPSQPGEYPATGALMAPYMGQLTFFCTGTLIAPDVVLTAAHCLLDDYGAGPPSFTLALNANSAPASAIVPGAKKVRHPMFDENGPGAGTLAQEHDIGLVFLSQPVTGVAPAVLPSPAEAAAALVVGAPLEIAGYGQTNAQVQAGGVKYDAVTTLQDVGPYEIQVGDGGEPQNCHGDSGGPAFTSTPGGQRLVGVVSRGLAGGEDSCDIGGIDSRVDVHLGWIHATAPQLPCGTGLNPPCAGAPDAGTPPAPPPGSPDAGVEPPGGGAGGDGADDAAGDNDLGGGCGCEAGGRARPRAGLALVLLPLLLLARRRRA